MPRPVTANPAPLKIKPRSTQRMTWRGITFRIRYHYKAHRPYPWAHLGDRIDVQAIGPNADLCPWFSPRRTFTVETRTLRLSGGPAAYVHGLLDAAARDPRWQKVENKRRQLDMFTRPD